MRAARLSASALTASPSTLLTPAPALFSSRIPSPQCCLRPLAHQQLRHRHVSLAPRPTQVPPPTPFVPDVPTLLSLIGRDLKKFAEKFPTWEALFTLTSEELRELGVEPARTRKYLLRWLERFRNGEYGPGGDLAHVRDGIAALRIGRDLKRDTAWVVNIPLTEDTTLTNTKGDTPKTCPGASTAKLVEFLENTPRDQHAVPRDYHAHRTGRISGPYATPNPREVGGATVRVTDGMWEERRGVKLDGGERRRDQVRFMRRVKERRALKETRQAEEAARRG